MEKILGDHGIPVGLQFRKVEFLDDPLLSDPLNQDGGNIVFHDPLPRLAYDNELPKREQMNRLELIRTLNDWAGISCEEAFKMVEVFHDEKDKALSRGGWVEIGENNLPCPPFFFQNLSISSRLGNSI